MKNFNFRQLLPHVIAIVVFVVVAAFFCRVPLSGKVPQQHDVLQFEGMSKDIVDYSAAHNGERPLWTNSTFSGMPTYQISMPGNNVLPWYANAVFTLGLPRPMQFFFLACLMFYFLSQVLRINPFIGIVGALGFAYATYDPVILNAGHETKMWCIAYMPALLGAIILAYEKKYWWGIALTALFTSIIIGLNHLQISYYFFMAALAMSIVYIVKWIKDKDYKHLLKALLGVGAGAIIGIMVNAVILLTTAEYAKATIRGGSLSLAADTATQTKQGGLTKDYAFSYSFRPAESFTVIVPRIFGGSNGIREIGENSNFAEALGAVPQQMQQQLYQVGSSYWGNLGSTSGPAYMGAIICFLMLAGFFVTNSKHRWWILGISIWAFLFSWGNTIPFWGDFLFNNLPLYNKFRAPSMIFVLLQLCFPLMAMITLQQILFGNEDRQVLLKKFKKALIAIGVVFAVLLLLYFSLSYTDEAGRQLRKQVANADPQVKDMVKSVLTGIQDDRKSIFMADLLRSFALIAVVAALLWLFIKNIIKSRQLVIVLTGLLLLIDLLPIGSMYFNKRANNEDFFVEKEVYETDFSPGAADVAIKKDTGTYRVLDLSGQENPFSNALPSYFHKSIGGYHAAKLAIYQDLIENKISAEINYLATKVNGRDAAILQSLDDSCQALNMLNTKYVILNNPKDGKDQPFYITNKKALGPCWIVSDVQFVKGGRAEMDALSHINPAVTAVVDESFKKELAAAPTSDSTARISLVKNENDKITYTFSGRSPQFCVFSEVYYKAGWNAYIDGKKSDYVKCDYVLRGMMVPAGQHTIEFKMEPESFIKGKLLTTIGQILVLLLLAVAIFFSLRDKKVDVKAG